jgi:hypothetical protein
VLAQWQALRDEAPGHALVALHGAHALAETDPQAAVAALDALADREPRYAIRSARHDEGARPAVGRQGRAPTVRTRGLREATVRRNARFPSFPRRSGAASSSLTGWLAMRLRCCSGNWKTTAPIKGAFLISVRNAGASGFAGTVLVIRIDPEAMLRSGTDQIEIKARCQDLLALAGRTARVLLGAQLLHHGGGRAAHRSRPRRPPGVPPVRRSLVPRRLPRRIPAA